MFTTSAIDTDREATRRWWLFLLTGVLWIFYAFVVLSFTLETVWAVAVLFGVGFIMGGILELMLASVAEGWRWLHVVFGIVAILAGITALAWPGQTFLALAAIAGWFLMLDGIMTLAVSITTRDVNDLWWLGVVVGIGEILIGFWAVGYEGRSITLLVVWVAAGALARGISDLMIGFSLHGADRQLRKAMERPAA